jgi:N-acetyl sugar amidotransferase
VCGACLYWESKKDIDWDARWEELELICEHAKAKSKLYDCVVGVSGGKDSTFQAVTARDRLGLHVLLVNSEPENITEAGRANIENLKQMGFDCISLRPNPQVMHKLMRRDFFEHLNPVKVSEYSLWSSAYIIALAFDIPLIIQGENAGLTQGVRRGQGMGASALNVWGKDTLSENWIAYVCEDAMPRDLFMYHYSPAELQERDIQAVWLQYFCEEWSQPHNAAFSMARGLQIRPEREPKLLGTYRRFYQIDSDLVQVNQVFKYHKLGFGQCTDHANYDIRAGLITREEGIALVREFDGLCDSTYQAQFRDYLGLSLTEYYETLEKWGPVESHRIAPEGAIWKLESPSSDINPYQVRSRLDEQLMDDVERHKQKAHRGWSRSQEP